VSEGESLKKSEGGPHISQESSKKGGLCVRAGKSKIPLKKNEVHAKTLEGG